MGEGHPRRQGSGYRYGYAHEIAHRRACARRCRDGGVLVDDGGLVGGNAGRRHRPGGIVRGIVRVLVRGADGTSPVAGPGHPDRRADGSHAKPGCVADGLASTGRFT